MALNTGKIITRNQWVELPITDEVIREVEALGKQQKQPNVEKHGYFFSWSKLRSFSNVELSPALIQLADEGAITIEEIDAQPAPAELPEPELLQEPEHTTAIIPFEPPNIENDVTTLIVAKPPPKN